MTATTLGLPLGGIRILARVEGDPTLLRRLRQLYPSARRARGRPDVEIDSLVIRRNGVTVLRSRRFRQRLAWTEWAIASSAETRMCGLRLHAAWASRGPRSVLLAGPHGRGKTTLSLALALRLGWRVLADDLLLVGPDGRPRAVRRPARIKPGMARVLPETARFRDGMMRVAQVRRLPRVTAVILLGPPGRGRARLVPLPQGIAVARLAQLSANLREDPGRGLSSLARLTGQAPTAILQGGTLARRVEMVRNWVLESR